MPRVLKQLLYGIFYMVFFGAIGIGTYAFSTRQAPTCVDGRQNGAETGIDCGGQSGCTPCDIKALKPLEAISVEVFRFGDAVTVSVKARNPNAAYGSDDFHYRIDLYGSNNALVRSISGSSFIYPSEEKYLVEAGIQDSRKLIKRVQFTVEPATMFWKRDSEFKRPEMAAEIGGVQIDSDLASVILKVKNPNNFAIRNAEVTVSLADQGGALVGISKTAVERLVPFEEREAVIFLPAAQGMAIDPQALHAEVYPIR